MVDCAYFAALALSNWRWWWRKSSACLKSLCAKRLPPSSRSLQALSRPRLLWPRRIPTEPLITGVSRVVSPFAAGVYTHSILYCTDGRTDVKRYQASSHDDDGVGGSVGASREGGSSSSTRVCQATQCCKKVVQRTLYVFSLDPPRGAILLSLSLPSSTRGESESERHLQTALAKMNMLLPLLLLPLLLLLPARVRLTQHMYILLCKYTHAVRAHSGFNACETT